MVAAAETNVNVPDTPFGPFPPLTRDIPEVGKRGLPLPGVAPEGSLDRFLLTSRLQWERLGLGWAWTLRARCRPHHALLDQHATV